jgi:hypothetical protein
MVRTHAGTLIVTVVAALAAACGSDNGSTSDAASDAGTGSEGGTQLCDPAAQDCASGSKCDFGCEGTTAVVACRPDNGSAAIGAACSTTTMQCAKGSGCVAIASGGGPLCRKYCAGDGDCATGERCHNDSVGVACGAPATTLLLHFCY